MDTLLLLLRRGRDASRRSQALTQHTETGSGSDGLQMGRGHTAAFAFTCTAEKSISIPTRQVRENQRELSLREEETDSRSCRVKVKMRNVTPSKLLSNAVQHQLSHLELRAGLPSNDPCSLTYKPGNLLIPERLLGEQSCSPLCATFAKLKHN